MNILLQLFSEGTIPLRIQIVAIGSSLALLMLIIQLIRRGLLKEGYSIIWFLIGVATVVLSLIPRLLDRFSHFVGISYAPAALFLILIGGLFLLAVNFSVLISVQDKKIREMAQEQAILKLRLKQLDKDLQEL